MEKNKLEKLAGIKKRDDIKVSFDDSNILNKLDELKNSLPEKAEFDDTNIVDGLDEIKNILSSNDKSGIVVLDSIKGIISKLESTNKNVETLDKKIVPVEVDFTNTNKALEKVSRNIIKLETPFVWIKDYFAKVLDYLKEIIFFFEKPTETIVEKKDGKATQITYKYKNREVTEKIYRNIGQIRFTRNERRDN